MAKVKESSIGKTVFLKSIGSLTITEKHASILALNNKFEHLEGARTVKKLKPLTETAENAETEPKETEPKGKRTKKN